MTTLSSDIDEKINEHLKTHKYKSDDKLAKEIAEKLGLTCISHIKRRIKTVKGEDNENTVNENNSR